MEENLIHELPENVESDIFKSYSSERSCIKFGHNLLSLSRRKQTSEADKSRNGYLDIKTKITTY